MTACGHGMPTPAACVECMAEGNFPTSEPKPKAQRTIRAMYNGHCSSCFKVVTVGDRIGFTDEGWACEECLS